MTIETKRQHFIEILLLLSVALIISGCCAEEKQYHDRCLACVDAAVGCNYYHPGSSVTGKCLGVSCTPEMKIVATHGNNGLANQLAANTNGTNYPKTWKLSLKEEARLVWPNRPEWIRCELEAEYNDLGSVIPANKVLTVTIPDDNNPNTPQDGTKCLLTFKVPPDEPLDPSIKSVYYYEHFGSNEDTPCLGWVECRQSTLLDQPGPIPSPDPPPDLSLQDLPRKPDASP